MHENNKVVDEATDENLLPPSFTTALKNYIMAEFRLPRYAIIILFIALIPLHYRVQQMMNEPDLLTVMDNFTYSRRFEIPEDVLEGKLNNFVLDLGYKLRVVEILNSCMIFCMLITIMVHMSYFYDAIAVFLETIN